MADLSALSDADLMALKSGDLTKVSDAGLMSLRASDPATPKPEGKIPPTATTAEAIAGNPITRFAMGAAAPVIGAAQLYSNLDPMQRASGVAQRLNEHLKSLESMKETGMKAAGNEGFDWAGLAGNVANPVGWAAAKALPAVAGLPARMGQGAAFGAATGATMPVANEDFAGTKVAQTAFGAGLGGFLPVAISTVKAIGGTAKDVADLIAPGGAERIFKRYQDRIIGMSAEARQQIITALRSAEEYVKGSKPTAAEALVDVPAGSPLASYQSLLAQTPGGPSGAFGQRVVEQEGARRGALSTIAQTPEALQEAIRSRTANAGENYGSIAGRLVNPRSDVEIMQEAIAAREAARVAALQDQGRFQTMAAQQEGLSQGVPVNLSPRQTPNEPYFNVGATGGRAPAAVNPDGSLPGNIPFRMTGTLPERRLTNNFAQSLEAEGAAKETGWIANYRKNEREFLEGTLETLKNTVGMSDTSLTKYLSRPSMQAALRDAAESAAETGSYFPQKAGDKFSVANLQRIKESLDNGILAASNAAKSGKRPELSEAELTGTRNEFVKWLSNKVPEWRDARQAYGADSRVIDRMKVGQNLQDKLVSATDKETPASFAQAVRNEAGTLKRATGQPRYDELSQLLTPKEMETVNSVLQDVTRKSRAFQQPQRTNLSGGLSVAEETTPRLPNLLSTTATITNKVLKALGNRTERELEKIATEAYLNPNRLADLLEKMPAAKKNKLLEILGNPQISVGMPTFAASQGQ